MENVTGVVFDHNPGMVSLIQDDGKVHHFALRDEEQKRWDRHILKLNRSNLPAVAVNTVVSSDESGLGFGIDGIASKVMLLVAKKQRELVAAEGGME